MLFDMLNPLDVQKFKEKTEAFIEKAKKLKEGDHNGKNLILELKEKQAPKTIQQNAYLWVTITYVALELGYTKIYVENMLKEACRDIFLQRRQDKRGNWFEYYRSISTLTKEEMSDCIDKWLHHCAIEFGIVIPTPDDYYYIRFMTRVEQEAEQAKEFL